MKPKGDEIKVAQIVATVAALGVPIGGLLGKPKIFDCPQCKRAKLVRGNDNTYCQRCAYVQKR